MSKSDAACLCYIYNGNENEFKVKLRNDLCFYITVLIIKHSILYSTYLQILVWIGKKVEKNKMEIQDIVVIYLGQIVKTCLSQIPFCFSIL